MTSMTHSDTYTWKNGYEIRKQLGQLSSEVIKLKMLFNVIKSLDLGWLQKYHNVSANHGCLSKTPIHIQFTDKYNEIHMLKVVQIFRPD